VLLVFSVWPGYGPDAAEKTCRSHAVTAPTVAGPAVDKAVDPAEQAACKVPDFAIAIGHADKWKRHNNCKCAWVRGYRYAFFQNTP